MVMMKKMDPIKPKMPMKPMPKPIEMDLEKPMSMLGEKLKTAKLEHCMCHDMADNMGKLMAKDPSWKAPDMDKLGEWMGDLAFKLKDTDHSGMISEKEFGIQEGFFKKFSPENAAKMKAFEKRDMNNDGMLSRDEFGGMKAMAHMEKMMPMDKEMPAPPILKEAADFVGF